MKCRVPYNWEICLYQRKSEKDRSAGGRDYAIYNAMVDDKGLGDLKNA